MLPLITKHLDSFIVNKYLSKYNNIIENAISQNRKFKETYYEKHHIIPRSLVTDVDDTILLTAREHFVCHWLLCKCTNSHSLRYAFYAMCNQRNSKNQKRDYIFTSKTYEIAKRSVYECPDFKNSAKLRGIENTYKYNKEERSKRFGSFGESNPMFGKKHDQAARKKMSEANIGRKQSEEFKRNMSRRMKGAFGGKPQDGKLNNKFVGYYQTPYREEPFESTYQASRYILENFGISISYNVVLRRCNNPDKVIKNKLSIAQSPDLFECDIGKTFGELGWWLDAHF